MLNYYSTLIIWYVISFSISISGVLSPSQSGRSPNAPDLRFASTNKAIQSPDRQNSGLRMANVFAAPISTLLFSSNRSSSRCRQLNSTTVRQCQSIKHVGVSKSLEELYGVRVERKVSPKRLEELGVSNWSVWKTGKCRLPWDWQVDQLVYIEEGEVRVVPEGSERYMQFLAGDLVRYPKWLEADLYFNAPYQERYSFRAYGDDN